MEYSLTAPHSSGSVNPVIDPVPSSPIPLFLFTQPLGKGRGKQTIAETTNSIKAVKKDDAKRSKEDQEFRSMSWT